MTRPRHGRPRAAVVAALLSLGVAGCVVLPPPLAAEDADADAAVDASEPGDLAAADVAEVADGDVAACVFGCDEGGASLVATAVAAGAGHACALAGDEVFCWGDLAAGAPGAGFLRAEAVPPVRVAGLAGAARAVVAGADHTCALLDGGGVACWGSNERFQAYPAAAGNQHLRWLAAPGERVPVAPARALAAGGQATCARLEQGGVTCWGFRLGAELPQAAVLEPYAVGGLDGVDVGAIAVGVDHACALSADGQSVRCFGAGDRGQLGDGARDPELAAVPVHAALERPVSALAAGDGFTCAAVDAGHHVQCWGAAPGGAALVPTRIDADFDPPIARLAAGGAVACAVDTAGGLACWGDNGAGQLAVTGLIRADVPVPVGVDAAPWAEVAVGAAHVCGVTVAGAVRCWGDASRGQLGGDAAEPVTTVVYDPALRARATCEDVGESPVAAVGPCTVCAPDGHVAGCPFGCADGRCLRATAVDAGSVFGCALLDDRRVGCWGYDAHGALGRGAPRDVTEAFAPVAADHGWDVLAAGRDHVCAVDGGALACWGRNQYGQLGVGDQEDRGVPTPVVFPGVVAVAATSALTCATDGAEVRCWGRPVGTIGSDRQLTPAPVAGLPAGDVRAVGVGVQFACAVVRPDGGGDDVVACWGDGRRGALGPATTEVDGPPTVVPGLPGRVRDLAVGADASCVLGETGALVCWGSDSDALLAPSGGEAPGPVDLTARFPAAIVAVDAFDIRACVALADGRAACWGRGGGGAAWTFEAGKLADVVVSDALTDVARVAVGAFHDCALDALGFVRCWGTDGGALGSAPWIDNPRERVAPTLVGDLDPWP